MDKQARRRMYLGMAAIIIAGVAIILLNAWSRGLL